MQKKDFSKIAATGLISGAVFLSACSNSKKGEATSKTNVVEESGYDLSNLTAEYVDQGFSAVHTCAGLNICKGLGGCKVTAEKLVKLAGKMGVAVSEAGEAHTCAGLNECKGLGGCKVSVEKFVKLKSAQLEADQANEVEINEVETNEVEAK